MRRGKSADALGMSMYPPMWYALCLNRTLKKHERTSTKNERDIILKSTYQALQIPLGELPIPRMKELGKYVAENKMQSKRMTIWGCSKFPISKGAQITERERSRCVAALDSNGITYRYSKCKALLNDKP